jgi:hypothetical protein
LPKTLEVREIRRTVHRQGYRDYALVVWTTLLDPQAYPADEVAALYLRRWYIELDLRTLKHRHGLQRLRTQTPPAVVREIYSAVLAFNAVRVLMAQTGQPVRALSHERARALLVGVAAQMSAAPAAELPERFRLLLRLLGQACWEARERPPEPRAAVHKPQRYPFLTRSRKSWRAKHHVA